MASMFTETSNIKEAVTVINKLNTAKFPLLLSRVIQKLHLKDEHAFSAQEADKLLSAFSIGTQELDSVIQTCEFFLQQAAFHTTKPAVLHSQLTALHLDEDKVDAIVSVWQSNAKEVVDELRTRTLPPKQLETVGWRLNLTMGSSSQTKQKNPNATIELGVKDDPTKEIEQIRMEFDHQELYKFYDQLEAIQSQIDALS